MAAATKFHQFVEDLGLGVHDFSDHTLKVALSDEAIDQADETFSDISELANGNGYTSGGETTAVAGYSQTGGTATLTLTAVTWTASGSMGPFRSVVLYNDTPTSPEDPLILAWDRGSDLTLTSGETFTWKPNNSATTGSAFTLS